MGPGRTGRELSAVGPTVGSVIVPEVPAKPAAATAGCQPLNETDFVVVDVETTGWSPGVAGITEIGAVRVRGGRVLGEFSCLVNPGRAIPAQVSALTGIDDAMVCDAPPVARVLPTFLAFAHGSVLAAHNAPFDVGFLTAACQAAGVPWPEFPVLDTVDLARHVLADEVPNCKLATLAKFFGARTSPRHRALADALATADVLAGLMRRLAATGITTLAGMRQAQSGTLPPSVRVPAP